MFFMQQCQLPKPPSAKNLPPPHSCRRGGPAHLGPHTGPFRSLSPAPFPGSQVHAAEAPNGLSALAQQKTSCPEKPADGVSPAALAEGAGRRVPSYFRNRLRAKSLAPTPGAAWTHGQKALLSSLMHHT